MVPVNNTANAPLGVVNNGNAAATVTLVSSSDKFRVSPAAPAPVDGGVSNMLTAFFTPDASFLPDGGVRTENGTLAMNVGLTDVLCAALPPAMTMTGTGTTGSVSYTPAALSFGSVDCGQTAAPKQVTFSNLGTQSYQILSATLGGKADGGFSFSVAMSPDSGVAASDGGTVVLTVTPLSIPQTSDVTANLYGDTLTVTTDVLGDSPHSVALDETAHGAIFGISANSLNFGFVVVGGTSTATFTISNSGNVAGTITITPASPTIFALPQNAVIDANSAAMQSATFHPLAPATYSDTGTISLSPSTVLCQPLPFSTIALSGQGSSSNVVVLSPTDLNFGLVKCGTTAGAKTIIVTNNSSQTLTFTLTLGAGAALFSASGLSTLTQGASGMITVTAKPVPARASTAPDAFTDTLSIRAVGAPVDETHIVALHQTAEGAILTFNPSAINFNGSGSRNFTVNNAGNLTATFTLTEAGANFSVNPTGASVNAGASAQETATYNRPPLGLGNKTATVSITSATTQCETLPPALTMIGN